MIRLDNCELLKNEDISETEIKKEYLKEYGRIVRQMERSNLLIQEMRLNAMMPAVVNDGMPHAHNNTDLSSYAAMLDQEEKRYMKYRYRRIKKCKEIRDKIEQLASEDEKDVLIYRYIKLMKWEDICIKMKHSWQHIHRIHAKALKNFKM